jgi:CTP synthase (UTP-ammonia lyase)
VVTAADAPSIYDIPKVLHSEGLDAYVVRRLNLPFRDVDWTVRAASQAEPGGPLWQVIEHMVERVQGVQSSKEALELVRATAGQPRP